MWNLLSVLVLALMVAGCAGSGEEDADAPEGEEAGLTPSGDMAAVENGVGQATEEQIAAYPLEVCAVSGEPLGSMGDAIDYFADGKLVRLCCDHCIDQVKEDPETILTKIAEAGASVAAAE